MYSKKIKIWIIVCISVLLLVIAFYYGSIPNEFRKEEPKTYSVLLYQDDNNQWKTLLNGISQASEDYHIKINTIIFGPRDSEEYQFNTIKKEGEKNINGMIIFPISTTKMESLLSKWTPNLPVISLEYKMINNMPAITVDDYKIGEMLANKVIKNLNGIKGKTITIVDEYRDRIPEKNRYSGFVDTIYKAGSYYVENVSRQKGDFDLKLYLQANMGEFGSNVVALDKIATEALAAAYKNTRSEYGERNIYGISATPEIVGYIDSGIIKGIVYQNEFYMGYKAVWAIVNQETNGYWSQELNTPFYYVDKSTLYDEINQGLLFPN